MNYRQRSYKNCLDALVNAEGELRIALMHHLDEESDLQSAGNLIKSSLEQTREAMETYLSHPIKE